MSEHHPEAVRILKRMAELDVADEAGLKFGGDGDLGETLLYLMSAVLRAQPAPEPLVQMFRAFVKKVESECRNELARGQIQGFAPDGPHAVLWTGLRDEARSLLLDYCEHGNAVPDPDCGCGC